MKNIFCIDLEDWYHQSLTPQNIDKLTPRVEQNTDRLLQIFSDTNTKATFFTLGQIAQRHPELIRKIQKEGHEIACHGYNHELLYSFTPENFREDVKKASALIEDACGAKTRGYRAPSWSVNDSTIWALEILQELGFEYDSSVFPVKNFLYGMPHEPRFAHQREVNGKPFWEIPPSTFSFFGKNMGFSGGFYFRAFPTGMMKTVTNHINKQEHPAVFYLHPVEIDRGHPKSKVNLRDSIILNWGIGGCEKKLIKILSSYEFVTIENYYLKEGQDTNA